MIFDDLLADVNEITGNDASDTALRSAQVFRIEGNFLSYAELGRGIEQLISPFPYQEFCLCFSNHVFCVGQHSSHENGMPSEVTIVNFGRGQARFHDDETNETFSMATNKNGWGSLVIPVFFKYDDRGNFVHASFGEGIEDKNNDDELLQELPGSLKDVPAIADSNRVLCRFIAFLSCKNVRAVDVSPSAKIQAARMRRKKLPLVSFKVLQLKPAKGSSAGGKDLWTNRVHLCRGHFAEYGPDAPLFGKHIGRFWIPPHARGDRSAGIVHKHYNIAQGALA